MNKKIEELRKAQQALSEKIDALEQELKAKSQDKWKPELNEPYYVAAPTSRCFYDEYTWLNDDYDNHCYNAGLICKTESEAIKVGKQMYYRQWYDSLSDVTNEMWKDNTMKKFYAHYNRTIEEVECAMSLWCMNGSVYFTSTEKLKQAIETIGGEDILKRYVLGAE